MKNIIISISIVFFVILGTLFSLIALYASPDEQVHFQEASYFWIGNSITIAGLLYYFKKSNS